MAAAMRLVVQARHGGWARSIGGCRSGPIWTRDFGILVNGQIVGPRAVIPGPSGAGLSITLHALRVMASGLPRRTPRNDAGGCRSATDCSLGAMPRHK